MLKLYLIPRAVSTESFGPLTKATRRTIVVFAIIFAAVIATTNPATPAMATSSIRTALPIVAGTELQFPDGECTAGLVLRATGVLSTLTAYRRNERYVLTARHCGEPGARVYVSGSFIGTVSWISGDTDLELIAVPPRLDREYGCSGSALHCSPILSYEPRAVGKIVGLPTGSRVERVFPVRSTGTPGASERFCTSGISSNTICTWQLSQDPPLTPDPDRLGKVYAETYGANILAGDSGGPVSSLEGNRVYGIISEVGRTGSASEHMMSYIDINEFFREQHGYALAP